MHCKEQEGPELEIRDLRHVVQAIPRLGDLVGQRKHPRPHQQVNAWEVRHPASSTYEQAAIVRFLDHADEQIHRYIASKERLIALMEEERQALVHQVVTRGLDPSIQPKPFGVECWGTCRNTGEFKG